MRTPAAPVESPAQSHSAPMLELPQTAAAFPISPFSPESDPFADPTDRPEYAPGHAAPGAASPVSFDPFASA